MKLILLTLTREQEGNEPGQITDKTLWKTQVDADCYKRRYERVHRVVCCSIYRITVGVPDSCEPLL